MINDMLQDASETFSQAEDFAAGLSRFDFELDENLVYKQLAEQLLSLAFAVGFILNLVRAEDEYQEEGES